MRLCALSALLCALSPFRTALASQSPPSKFIISVFQPKMTTLTPTKAAQLAALADAAGKILRGVPNDCFRDATSEQLENSESVVYLIISSSILRQSKVFQDFDDVELSFSGKWSQVPQA